MTEEEKFIQDTLNKLGERLRQLRKDKGYSNYEFFAYENKISRSQYGRYEKGTDLRFSSFLKLIHIHDITLSEFFAEGFEDDTQEK